MMIDNKSNGWKASIWLMMFYAIWRFLLINTTWGFSRIVYVCFTLLFCILLFSVVKIGRFNLYNYSLMCVPFILYITFRYIISGDFETGTYYIDCLLLIIIASNCEFTKAVPKKLFLWSGIVVMFGILIQLIAPDFYYSNIASNFTSYSQIKYWGSVSYYAGFTYQVGHSAEILLVAEGTYLYFSDKFTQKKVIRALITALFIMAIFLTGKRSLSILSILVPLLVYCLSANNSGKHVKRLLIVTIVFLTLALLFFQNLETLSSSSIFGIFSRFTLLTDRLSSGSVIDANRESFSRLAIQSFKENPILGIGAGKYIERTGAYSNAHDVYLQFLCELGIIGFALFIFMLLYYLFRTVKLLKVDGANKYLAFSLFIQLEVILNSFTENFNMMSYFTYFLAVGIYIYSFNQVAHRQEIQL